MPLLDAATKKSMIENPELNVSDSFYFIGDNLVLHNKSSYVYQ